MAGVVGYLTEQAVIEGLPEAFRNALGDALVRLSLFGSRARGEADPASDFDLLVVVARRDPALKRAVYAVVGDYLVDHRVDLSAKVLPLDEFDRLRTSGLPFWRAFDLDEVRLWPPRS